MNDRLFVYIKSLEPSNVVLMIEEETSPSHYKIIESISELSAPYKTVVIVSPWDVSLHTVPLPKMKHSQQHQAILYSLEDQLIDKIEDLHFAYRLSPDQKTAAVAVISHKKMKDYQERLAALGIQPVVMIPAASLMPETDPLTATEQEILFKTPPDEIDLIPRFQEKEALNLLQHTYAPSKNTPWDHHKTTIIFSSFLLLLSLVFILKLGFLFKLNSDLHQISKGVTTIYVRYFPQATAVVAPKSRLNILLVEREKLNREQPLLQMLQGIAQSIESTPSLAITGLQYQNQILTFTVTTHEIETLSLFNQQLKKSGYSVVQKNTTSASHTITALFEIRGHS